MKAAWENEFYIMNDLSGVRYNINISEVMEEGASESVHLPPAAPKEELAEESEEQTEPAQEEQAEPEEEPKQPEE
jgi:ribosomal protein L12E/L44/L45/RPP1/RPP2